MKWIWHALLDWLIVRLNIKPGGRTYGNCFLAWILYFRYDGHIIITKSASHRIIPHLSWAEKLPPIEVLHLQPVKRRYGWRALVCSAVFRGEWRREMLISKKD